MDDDSQPVLIALLVVFAPFSLTAFGGGLSVVSGIQHQSVDVFHWLTAQQFLGLFAISRAAPGPGSMLATVVGWYAAGWAGALIATAAMFIPSSLLTAFVASISRQHREKAWLKLIEKAVAPIGAGLAVAGVASVAQLVVTSVAVVLIGVAAGVAYYLRPSIPALLVIGAGAAANVAATTIGTAMGG